MWRGGTLGRAVAVSAPQKSRAVFARDRFRAGPGCGIISSAASSGAMRKDEFAMMIRIRPATPDDARELIDMNREFNGVDDLDEEQVRAELAGGAGVHLSISHDGGMALAFAVLEAREVQP